MVFESIPGPDDCEFMTVLEFYEAVKQGSYNHHDGTGYYALIDKMTDIEVDLSDIDQDRWTHVVWFNK